MAFMPLTRSEVKATVRPSGDHTGSQSMAGSDVKREGTPRSISTIQRSKLAPAESDRVTATRLPSGESARSLYRPGGPNSSHGVAFPVEPHELRVPAGVTGPIGQRPVV